MVKLLQIAPFAYGKPLFPILVDLSLRPQWLKSDLGVSALATIIPPTIERFCINGASISDSLRLKTCLEVVKERSGNGGLRWLELLPSPYESNPTVYAIERFEPCVTVIGALRDLRRIILPPRSITGKMFLVLISLPYLELLDATQTRATSLDPTASSLIKSQGRRYTGDDFPSLSALHLRLQWRTAFEIFQNVFPCDHSLRILNLILTPERCGDSASLARLLAQKFSGLQTLCFESHELTDSNFFKTMTQEMPLHYLSITSYRFSMKDLGQMVGIWSRLDSLTLEHLPRNYLQEREDFESLPKRDLSGLQLDGLGVLANGCPNLTALHITVNAGPTKHLVGLHGRFRKLHSLTFVFSFLNYGHADFDVLEAVLYISSLFDVRPSTLEFFDMFNEDFNEMPGDPNDPVERYLRGFETCTTNIENQLNATLTAQADLRRRLGIFGPH
jgi:hypothetical protein